MANKVNSTGKSFATSQINSGNVDKTSSWSFSTADGNDLLGPNGDDWANYGKHHLGIDASADSKTKAHWKYPFAKNGKVYRSGIIAVKQRAGGNGDTEILNAAGDLLDLIDKNKNDVRRNKLKNQNLPNYDPDGDGDNDAEEACGLMNSACVLIMQAMECLDPDSMESNTPATMGTMPSMRRNGSISNISEIIPFKNNSDSKSILRISAAKNNPDVYQMDMFGVVGGGFWSDGGITKETFANTLKQIPSSVKSVDMRMSSPGGDVFEGRAIANMMSDHRCDFNINIIAECCSIATIIAMAGNSIHMSDGSVFLVHRCYTMAMGNSQEMMVLAKDLELIDQTMVKTYQKKTNMNEKDVLNLMDENRYMDADEAKKLGFVDTISNDNSSTNANSIYKIAALSIDRSKLHLPPLPDAYQPRRLAALDVISRFKEFQRPTR